MIFGYIMGLATGIVACVLYRIVRSAFAEQFARCEAGAIPRLTMSSSVGETVYAMTSPGEWYDIATGKAAGRYVTIGRNPELTALYIAHKDEVKP